MIQCRHYFHLDYIFFNTNHDSQHYRYTTCQQTFRYCAEASLTISTSEVLVSDLPRKLSGYITKCFPLAHSSAEQLPTDTPKFKPYSSWSSMNYAALSLKTF
jgi:hypothetical protein